jgi:hypothetical protein
MVIEEQLPRGVHDARQLGRIGPYRFDLSLFPRRKMMLSLGRQGCRWRQCRFCHHLQSVYTPVPLDHVVESIVHYLRQGVDYFYLYDNEMDLREFAEVFEAVHQRVGDIDVRVGIFGSRILPVAEVDGALASLDRLLAAWTRLKLVEISLGMEFYDQEVLDWYRKGITIADIDATLHAFYRRLPLNTCVRIYLLAGLPRVRDHHIRSILEFERRHFLGLSLRYGFACLQPSFFRLSPHVSVYRNLDEFGIMLGDWYHINDFRGVDGLPNIRTRYRRFQCWDEDSGRYLSRGEVMEKHQVGLYRHCLTAMDVLKPESYRDERQMNSCPP